MLAYDLKLYLQHLDDSSSPTSLDIQHNINIIATTAASWGLQFAAGKCVHIRFKRGQGGPDVPFYHHNGVALSQVMPHKNLGFMMMTESDFIPILGRLWLGRVVWPLIY